MTIHSEERISLAKWLCQLDMEKQHREIQNQRIPGIGQWILHAPEFVNWAFGGSESQILWCPGLPVTGKTFLVSIIIDHLRRSLRTPNQALAYIYCGDTTPPWTAFELLSCMCRQLSLQCVDLPSQLTKMYHQMSPGNESLGIDDLVNILLSLCDSFDTVFVCVDSICEVSAAAERPILISKLQWLRNHGARILVTSTPHGDIVEACPCNDDINEAFKNERRLDIQARPEEIRKIILKRLEEQTDAEHLLSQSGSSIDAFVDERVAKCGGMILMAQLWTDRRLRWMRTNDPARPAPAKPAPVASVPTKAARTNILKKLKISKSAWSGTRKSKGNDTIFRRLEGQQPWRRDLALWTISLVYRAFEPLYLAELMVLLGMRSPGQYWICLSGNEIRANITTETVETLMQSDPNGDRSWKQAVPLTEICGRLISVDEDCRVHLSQSFNASPELDLLLSSQTHSVLAAMCLEYLCNPLVLSSSQIDNWRNLDEYEAAQRAVPFKKYAQNHWLDHYVAAGDPGLNAQVVEYFCILTNDPPRWIEERKPIFDDPYHVLVTDDESALLKAARLGMDRVVLSLLEDEGALHNTTINKVSHKGETPLSVAVDGGYTSTVHLLWRWGASIHHRDRYGLTLMHTAAEKNDEIMVALLAYCGLNVNTVGGYNEERPLHVAARKNSVRAAQKLLEYRADMFLLSRTETPMLIAASQGHEDFCRLLVEKGYDVSAPIRSGHGLLSEAVQSGSLSLVSYLLNNGADVLEADGRKRSAIHTAGRQGDLEILKLLMERGADPFVQDDGPNDVCDGSTALGAAIQEKHEEIVEYLLPRLSSTTSKDVILTMAASAIGVGWTRTAKRLLSLVEGDAMQEKRQYCNSVLGRAIVHVNEEMLRLILDRGTSPNAPDGGGWRPLHEAASRNDRAPAARILLQYGADPDGTTPLGVTPAHVAAYEGHVEVLKVLLQSGPTMSAVADDGSTSLVAAAYGSQPDAVRLLLQYGAPVNVVNVDGENALHHAIMDNDVSLVESMLEYDVDLAAMCRKAGSALHLAAFKGYADVLRSLLGYGADLELTHSFSGTGYKPRDVRGRQLQLEWNATGIESFTRPREWTRIKQGWTALHSAVCGGHIDVVEVLLRAGADFRAVGPDGESPLHLAASAAKAEIVSVLLRYGASISARTFEGDTPLHYAAAATGALAAKAAEDHFKCGCQLRKDAAHGHVDHNKTDCVAVLLQNGADAAAENVYGLTPLAVGAAAGHEDVTKALLDLSPSTIYSPAAYARIISSFNASRPVEVLQWISGVFDETKESQVAWHDLLIRACSASNKKLVALALSKGAPPSPASEHGPHPLVIAIESAKVEIVELLVAAGADLKTSFTGGINALHLTCKHPGKTTLTVLNGKGEKAMMASLLMKNSIHVNSRTTNGDSALHFAVATGDRLLVRTLLERGASVDIRNNRGSTPLHAAVATWVFSEVVDMLLWSNACPNAQDHYGRTPLHLIRSNAAESTQALEILLRKGADPSIRAYNGDLATHCATKRGDWTVVGRLLQAGASVHAKGAKGRTMLHLAAHRGYGSIIEALLKLGADVKDVDEDGQNALDLARDGEQSDAISLLLQFSGLQI